MCGVAVIARTTTAGADAAAVARMRDAVAHRGPDDAGIALLDRLGGRWSEVGEGAPWRVALGHRRLSILDLSAAGHQPMRRGDVWLVYNGEVYNFVELRDELVRCGHAFDSHGDTEVVLAAYRQWGPDCFARFRGMWGMVFVDGSRDALVLSRDRLGIKPLYLWTADGVVAVVSEPKQLLAMPGFRARLNRPAAEQFLTTGYEDPEASLFDGVRAVPAGTWMELPLGSLRAGGAQGYWHPEAIRPSVTDEREAARRFAGELTDSVRLHLRSDVPVGCALSGGLDSSAIAVIADGVQPDDGSMHTFSVTFPGDRRDERAYVDAVLREIAARPHFVSPTPDELARDLRAFAYTHDEPISGLSIYAGYRVAQLTRSVDVPVTLNGQGGDEILAGYWQSYALYLARLARTPSRWPSLLAQLGGAALPGGNPGLLEQLPAMARRYLARTRPRRSLLRRPGEPGDNPARRVVGMSEHEQRVFQIRTLFLPRLLKWDDRNSMAFSVEGRYPFLDHQLIELCLSFDSSVLYRDGWTKWPLRVGLADRLPAAIARRRSKVGFEVPQERWLAGPMRTLLVDWVRADRPAWALVDRDAARALVDAAAGARTHDDERVQQLLCAFMFDLWCELFDVAL